MKWHEELHQQLDEIEARRQAFLAAALESEGTPADPGDDLGMTPVLGD